MLVLKGKNQDRGTSSKELDELAGHAVKCSEFKYARGTEIFGEKGPVEYLYQIKTGAVRGYKLLTDGRRQIMAFHLPGDIFGVENSGVHRYSAEAIVETTVRLTKRHVLDENGDSASAVTNVRRLVTDNLRHAETHMLLLGRKTSVEKVAAFLVEMDIRSTAAGVLKLPMTRRDIGDYLGLTLESVSRAMTQLSRCGALSFSGRSQRQIILQDREKLAAFDH
jgi:CRP/FNR family nitrogen fixation transcriptional regulator